MTIDRGPTLHRPPADGPAPTATALSEPFWDGCLQRELRFLRCHSCDSANFEPGPACRRCGSLDLGWEVSSGRGSLYSWTVVWRPQSPEFAVPYACGIVTLDEGHRVLATIADCGPDELTDGLAVTVDFQPTNAGGALPFFRPTRFPEAES